MSRKSQDIEEVLKDKKRLNSALLAFKILMYWQRRLFFWVGLFTTIFILFSWIDIIGNIFDLVLANYVTFWVVMAVIGFILININDYFLQMNADIDAELVYRKVSNADLESEYPHFALYLRPFNSTGRLPINGAYYKPWLAFGGPGVQAIRGRNNALELETKLEKILKSTEEKEISLIGLGLPLEHYGAGRIIVEDDDWKDSIRKLIKASDVIFLVPWHTKGTKWEIKEILSSEENVKKTIFIFPKENTRRLFFRSFTIASGMDQIREIFYSLNKQVPEYTGREVWFRFVHDSKIKERGYELWIDRGLHLSKLLGLSSYKLRNSSDQQHEQN